MKRFSSTYLLLTLAILAALAGAGLPALVLQQKSSGFAYVSSVAQEAQAQAVRQQSARAARKLAMDTAPERAQLNNLSVGKDNAATFIEWVEATGRSAGVKLDVGSVTISGSDVLQALSMAVHASGTFSQVMHFLMLLETAPQAEKLSAVTLDHSEKWSIVVELSVPIHSQ